TLNTLNIREFKNKINISLNTPIKSDINAIAFIPALCNIR
ncbi:MAG: hypothetical protein ACI8ZO_001604, partial [Flavobacteriales bacterium]